MLEAVTNLIKDEKLKASCVLFINDNKDMLKTLPSSVSGRYHPIDERGPGGLVLHIKRVGLMCHELKSQFNLSDDETDYLLVAAIFHDSSNVRAFEQTSEGKLVQRKTKAIDHELVSVELFRYYYENAADMVPAMTISSIISSHTGYWRATNRQPTSSKLEMIFSTVDFILSRDRVQYDV
jgi:hypothetical protein